MKTNYRKPAQKVVPIAIHQKLLSISGNLDGEATGPAKGRSDNWDEEGSEEEEQ